MYETHLTGHWMRGQVSLHWAEAGYRSTPAIDAQIEAEWRAVKARLGDRIFDGPMCRMEKISCESNGQLRIELSQTSYRIFVGTNMAHPAWAETIGRQVMANTVGVSTTLITADGFVMLGRRSDNVAYYPRMLHPFSGSLEPSKSVRPAQDTVSGTLASRPAHFLPLAAHPPDLFDEALRELHEELGLSEDTIVEIACIGIIEDLRLRHPEAILYARSTRTRQQIEQGLQGNEHTAAWHCPASAAAIMVALADRSEFTPVAQGSLELLARHLGV